MANKTKPAVPISPVPVVNVYAPETYEPRSFVNVGPMKNSDESLPSVATRGT
jgi:hypothetical protein